MAKEELRKANSLEVKGLKEEKRIKDLQLCLEFIEYIYEIENIELWHRGGCYFNFYNGHEVNFYYNYNDGTLDTRDVATLTSEEAILSVHYSPFVSSIIENDYIGVIEELVSSKYVIKKSDELV